MAKLTSKNLFTLVKEEIDGSLQFPGTPRFRQQLERSTDVAPFAMSSGTNTDISAQELVRAVQNILAEALPPKILEGLTVVAEDPISANVIIAAGKGTVQGHVYELDEAMTLPITFDSSTGVYYVVLYQNTIMLEKTADPRMLTLAKIVVPSPGVTNKIRDDRNDGTLDAYIVQYQEYRLYGNANGKFEEETRDLLKDNIGDILAETIVGTITLSENLKITNVTGSLDMDSQSIKIKNSSGQVLAKFNRDGVFFNRDDGVELAKFSTTGARIGNIVIKPNALESANFISGLQGFQIKDSGDTEFNNITVRGTIHARLGSIGGFTITSTKLYGGTIQTGENVAAGQTGVVMDSQGLRGFNSILGQTFNLPTNGDAPTFASGIIRSTIFEINTSAVLRTGSTVGDGTSASAGILINNTGIYGCGANQTFANANLKALVDGTIRVSGTIFSTAGEIGSVTITSTSLSGGLIEGSLIRGATIETSSTAPRVRIDSTGIVFQITSTAGKYGASGSGMLGFKYGSGTKYGAGIMAYLFHSSYPTLTINAERTVADIRLYNRTSNPSGAAKVGDLMCKNGLLYICTTTGTPGTYSSLQYNKTIEIMFDGGGSTLPTGVIGDVEIPYACTITQATLLADQSGSIVIDIWKDTYANYPPTVADTITASAKPTISSATKSQDTTLTGWTTTVSAGDTLRFNIDSVTNIQRVVLSLKVRTT